MNKFSNLNSALANSRAGLAALSDMRALHTTLSAPPDRHGIKTAAGQAAMADFEAFIERGMPKPGPAAVIPPNPTPTGGITATMLRKLRGDGPQVNESLPDTLTENRMAIAIGRIDRMSEMLDLVAEQSAHKPKRPRP